MKKIINPVMCEDYNGKWYNAYVEIEYTDGKLSLHGVIGPMSNGNCHGSCGQCYDEILMGRPNQEWTKEDVEKLVDIWKRWHLNDMNPSCEHQRALGWSEKAKEEVTLYNYSLTTETFTLKRQIEKLALKALKEGETFTPTAKQTFIANLESFTIHEETLPKRIENYYKPMKPLWNGDKGFTEKKTLGWLYEKDHPEGLLCKPCPVCGYKYGTSWIKEDVPQEVIDWLFNLPNSQNKPAWV